MYFPRTLAILATFGMTQAVTLTAAIAADAGAPNEQPGAPPSEPLEQVTVTATRVARKGYDAPTPTTVVGPEILELQAPATLADALALLPSMRAPQDEGTGSLVFGEGVGRGFVNMRGLGPFRTLVLMDGQRLDANTVYGEPDLSLLPSLLIKRVDVVTGGTSAAYGSDAVAGVVNIILDSELSGFKAKLEGGLSSRSDAFERQVEVAWGGKLGERLHLVTSFEYFQRDGLGPGSREFATPFAVVPNPNYATGNGQKPLEIAGNAYDAEDAYGGLILNGPLAGQAFLPNGTTRTYAPPSCSPSPPYLVCNNPQAGLASPFNALFLTAPEQRVNFFNRLSVDPTPDVGLHVDALYATHESSITSGPFPSQAFNVFLPINVAQNAYLPSAIRDEYLTNGQTTLLLGRINEDEGAFEDTNRETMVRLAAAVDAKLPQGWALSSYVAYSKAWNDDGWANDFSVSRFLNAVDSVMVHGVPVCRINAVVVTDPSCAPANVFGSGNLSAASRAYFTGTVDNPLTTSQLAAALNLTGNPFSTWAGLVSLAAGAEARRDTAEQENGDPSGIFVFNGVPAFSGSTNVKEVYTEVVVPLYEDVRLARSLDVSGALRRTQYSQAGGATTWKLGINLVPVPDFRIRATASRDIRAPSLGELDTPSYPSSFTSLSNPLPNGVPLFNSLGIPPGGTVSVREIDGGRSSLVPEVAETTAVGFVLQPRVLPGFALSLDHYAIRIGNAIAALPVSTIVQDCAAGIESQCALISSSSNSAVSLIADELVNSEFIYTSGFDADLLYRFGIGGGEATVRALANYIHDYRLGLPGIPSQELVGDIGSGLPSLQGTVSATYSRLRSTFSIDGTYIGGGDYSKSQAALIENDWVPHVWYVGATVEQKLGGGHHWIVYGRVSNLFDQKPPSVALGIYDSLNNGIFTGVPYDRIGRYFQIGVRLNTD